jgi:hypothetical protein
VEHSIDASEDHCHRAEATDRDCIQQQRETADVNLIDLTTVDDLRGGLCRPSARPREDLVIHGWLHTEPELDEPDVVVAVDKQIFYLETRIQNISRMHVSDNVE